MLFFVSLFLDVLQGFFFVMKILLNSLILKQNASVHQDKMHLSIRKCDIVTINNIFFFIPFIIFFSFLLSYVFLYLWGCVVIIFLHIFSIIKKIFWVCKISSNKTKNTTIIIILLLYYFSCLAFLSIFQKM